MITPSFSPTATERVLPKLALDFTTATLDPRITFTRTTDATHPATYFDSNGLLSVATNNQPRFDYNSTTLACKGLLIEESRTNLLPYSSTYNTWTTIRSTLAQNAAISPDGSNNAVSLIEDSGTSLAKYTSYSLSVNGAITFSYYAKAGARTWTAIRIYDGSVDRLAFFNLSTGAIGTVSSGVTASIFQEKNGWYRCCFTYTFPSVSIIAQILITTGDNVVNYTGNGTSNIYIYGAQLEAGAFPTSYIPTTTTALTRNADVATMTGTNFSDWYNASEGTLKVTADTLSVAANSKTPTLASLYTDSSNLMRFWIWDGAPTSVRWTGLNALVTQFDLSNAPITANSNFSVVGAYKLNNFAQSINASVPSVDTSGTVPSITAFNIGSISGGSTQFWNGHITKILYWPQKLINAEVQSFSK